MSHRSVVRKSIGFAGVIVIGLLTSVGVSAAGPSKSPKATPVTVDCGNGPFTAYTNGNGTWTPAHVGGSNQVFHPTAFGEFNGTFTDNDGNTSTFTDPPFARKTTPRNGKPIIHCNFSVTFSDENGHGSGSGSVDGWISQS
jgi:hypothetical protein